MSKYYNLTENQLKFLLKRANIADYYEKLFEAQKPDFEPTQEQLCKYKLHDRPIRTDTLNKIEKIKKLLSENRGNMSEVARKMNVSKQCISQFINKYRIEIPDVMKERLTSLVNQGLTFSEIRAELGITAPMLHEKLEKYSLVTSDKVEDKIQQEKIAELADKGLSTSEIQKITGLPLYTVYRKLKKYSIKTKLSSERENVKNLIIELAQKGLSGLEIAEQTGISLSRIYYYSMRFKLNLTKNRKYDEKQ